MKSKTRIINFLAGPGAGKSTTASGLFSWMKQQNYSVELVQEYAKDCVYNESYNLLRNQVHVFAEQFHRQWRLLDKVDYVITDSPLILSSIYYDIYLQENFNDVFSEEYISLTKDYFDATFNEFNNINFFIERNKPFVQLGRVQTEDQSKSIDSLILSKFETNKYGTIIKTNSLNALDDTKQFIQNLK